ncbi:MAG: DMT family transporter [Sphaerochaeta sp.]
MEKEERLYVRGLMFAILGTVVLSLDALLIRLSCTSGISIVFYRALFTCISSSMIFFGTRRRKAFPILSSGGFPMILSGLLWGLSGVGFTLGVQTSGAANTLVFIALSPLFAAAFSGIFFKIVPSLSTILATGVSIFGIWFMYREGFGDLDPKGLAFALSAPIFLGSNLSFMRNHKEMARLPLVMIGGMTGSLIALIISQGNLKISVESILPLVLLGLVVIPFAQTMISTGTRYINAPEAALVNSSETVIGIFYVWLFLGETPNLDFMIGASIVLLSITVNSIYQAKAKK